MTVAELVATLGFEMNKGDKGKIESAVDGLKSYAEKALGAIGVGFSIAGIKQLVEVAADMKAIDTQFKQTFKDKETLESFYDAASKSLRKVSDETGIAESRMKKSFSDISAFAQTGGMKVGESLEFTERAMRVAADSAAYYDRSIEETTMLMKSLLKGNYMVDDNLGFQATELTRNAKAAELYGKKFNDLSEAQKQTTIVEMIAAANKAMGAEGQAANEAGEWTNTLGNLTARIRELKGAMGDAFLAPAIFVVKTLSRWTVTLTDAVKAVTKEGGLLQKVTKQWTEQGEKVRRTFSPAINMVLRGVNRLKTEFRIMKVRMGGFEDLFHVLFVAAMGFIGALAFGKIIAGLGTVLKLLKLIIGTITPIHIAVAILALLVEDFFTFLSGGDSVIGDVFGKFGITVEDVKKAIEDFTKNGAKKLKEFGRDAKQFLKTMKDVGKTVGKFLKDGWKGDFTNPLTPIFRQIKKMGPGLIGMFSSIIGAGQAFIDFVLRVKDVLTGSVFGPILNAFLGTFLTSIMNGIQALLRVINGVIGVVTGVFDVITGLLSGNKELILQGLQELRDGIVGIISGLGQFILSFLGGIVGVIGGIVTTALATIVAFFEGFGVNITGMITGLITSITTFVSQIPGIVKNGFQGAIDFLTSLPAQALKWGADFVQGIIDGITSKIDALAEAASGMGERIRSFFHFSRPDEGPLRDYETWMPDMMQGLASTMQSGSHVLIEQAAQIARGLTDSIHGAMAAMNADMAAMMNGFVSNASALANVAQASFAAARVSTVNNNHTASVTQNNTFNNSYSGGDRQTQKNVSKGMRRSAIDATTQMADALKYARG